MKIRIKKQIMKFKYPQKIFFGIYPTPIIPINNFFCLSNKYNVWIKRDDLTGLELSGNKVRKLEYIFADAAISNSNHVITCGGIQSNHCRTTAFLATRLQYDCTLFLKGQIPPIKSGNYLLNSILNVKIKNVTNEEYQAIDNIMAQAAQEINNTTYVIPEGGSNEIGVWGYIECFSEILKQIKEQNINIDTIIVPTGSGGTHAGLLLGKYIFNSDIEIISINVCDSSQFFINKINNIINKFASINNLFFNFNIDDIKIFDGYVGEGYGIVTVRETDIIKRFAMAEGIIIDPVYTAKALIGLEDLMKTESIPGKNILFIHTGGIFGLFSIGKKF
jgi:D-cysteine desulfhydrase